MITRCSHAAETGAPPRKFPVVAIVGARQTGKTTLAQSLLRHPRVGASWEGFAPHQIVRALAADWRDRHHWRLHTGAELDLLVTRGGRRIGFEIKRTDAPRVTPSMRSALDVLRLDKFYVVHTGAEAWPMDESIAALPLAGLFEHFRDERERG